MTTPTPHPNVVRARKLRADPNFQCELKDEAVEMHGGICPRCGEATQAHEPEPNPAPSWAVYSARMRKLGLST